MSPPAAPTTTGRYAQAGVLAFTVLVLAVVVVAVTWQLQAGLREQILQGEADKIAAIASMQLDNSAADLGGLPISEVPGTLLVQVLKISKLRGVMGVRVFDLEQRVSSHFGLLDIEQAPRASDWSRVLAGHALARLHVRLPNDDLFVVPPTESTRVIETWVPLQRTGSPRSIGAAQVWIDGGSPSAGLAVHDRRLWTQAVIAWLAGAVIIVSALQWAFRRLEASNQQLQERSDDLQRANRELVLAAKTSALGAVTAHLMHELKNPLAGLELIVAGQSEPNDRGESGGELAEASALTRRLRTMVNDVVGVLRDEQSGAVFELTAGDVIEIAVARVQSEAKSRQVRIETAITGMGTLTGRRGNLASLVLRNLLQNALEATPSASVIRVSGRADDDSRVEFLVEDNGPGLAPAVRSRLFQPCASTKVGGSGLGLALSHQLAQQAGGRLELVRSDEAGTCFRLVLMPEA